MILMAIPSSSTELVAVIASLSMLAPLVRALHKWHMDVRKTSKPAATAQTRQHQISTVSQMSGSRWSRMTGFERWTVLSNFAIYIVLTGLLLWMGVFEPAHPATTKDIAFVGMVVAMIVITTRSHDT
jgi:hypothetical protein